VVFVEGYLFTPRLLGLLMVTAMLLDMQADFIRRFIDVVATPSQRKGKMT
jgi:hypothetical protein